MRVAISDGSFIVGDPADLDREFISVEALGEGWRSAPRN